METMNTLFYYEELRDAAYARLKQLASKSLYHKDQLLALVKEHCPRFPVTSEDVEKVMQNMANSMGTLLCPQASAEYAGIGKLWESESEQL